jgi:LPXTG-motif cell wall-anchored protein
MKKFIIAATAVAFIGIGGSPAFAQSDPEPIVPIPEDSLVECGESDGRTDVNGDGIADACLEFYVEAAPPTTVAPSTTTTTTIAIVQGPLPETGSGVSPILGMGAALLIGGGLVVVATRRRSTATAN